MEMRGYKRLVEAQQSYQPGEFLVGKDIASGGIKRYYVFSSLEEFEREQWKHRMHWYEVVNGRQRLYFDLDISHEKLLSLVGNQSEKNYSSWGVEENISLPTEKIDQICEDFFSRFLSFIQGAIPDVQINTYISHTQGRHSYHIILLNCFARDHRDCGNRVQRILNAYKAQYYHQYQKEDIMTRFIDMSLYKKSQLFRLLNSTKIDKDNVKKIYKCDITPKNEVGKIKFSLLCHYLD